MTLEVAGTPAGLTGSLRLLPSGEMASRVEIDGDLVAKVPLLGPRLEKAAAPATSPRCCVPRSAPPGST